MTLYCATGNGGKLREFQLAASLAGIEVAGIPNYRQMPKCEETGATFAENAILKTLHYAPYAPGPVFADDSGLAVDALNGAPGVYSARYAGPRATDAENNALLLQRLRGVKDRRARFVCVIALIDAGELRGTFEAHVEGEMLEAPRGAGGFGYDPLFYYAPYGCTFGEASEEQKLAVSHRGQAFRLLLAAKPLATAKSRATPATPPPHNPPPASPE